MNEEKLLDTESNADEHGGESLRGPSLDLGLGDLLTHAAQESSVEAAATTPPTNGSEVVEGALVATEDSQSSALSAVTVAEPPPPPSPYQILADSHEWQMLSDLAESKLEGGGDVAIEAKLWWIKAQLHLALVPVGILSAPLDEATNDLASLDPRNKRFAVELLREAVARLRAVDESEFALRFAERGWRGGFITREELLACISSERKRISAIDDRKRVEEKNAKLEELSALEKGLRVDTVSKAATYHSSPSRNCERDDSVQPQFSEPQIILNRSGDFGEDLLKTASPPPSATHAAPSQRKAFISATLFLLFLLLVSSFLFDIPKGIIPPSYQFAALTGGGGAEILPPPLAIGADTPLSKSPPLELAQKVSNLDALYYETEHPEEHHDAAQAGNTAPVAAPVKREAGGIVPIAPAVDSPPGQKEVVNTTSPVEDRPPPSGSSYGSERPRDDRPRDNSSFETKSEDDSRKSPLFDRPDGRMRSGWDARPPGTGSSTRSGEDFTVEQYGASGRWFRVSHRTDVMERPSFKAYQVAELQVDDRVLADRRVGEWLELRSKRGRPGFILARDAVED